MLIFLKLAAVFTMATIVSAPAVSADMAFVTVNGVVVSQATADIFVASGKAQGLSETPELRNKVREELIRRELMLQEAKKDGIDKRPDVAAEAEAEKQKMIVQAEAAKQTIIIRAYVRDLVKRHPVTDEQLKATYDAYRARGGDTEYKVRHILLRTEADAKAVIAKLNQGGKFAELAKQSIDTGSAASDGDLGWSSPAKFVKPFADALAGLKKGKYSAVPVKTEFGYHVIQLEDTRPLKVPSFDEMKHMLQKDAEAMMVDKMIAELRSKAKIQ
jgi:peptidyl-prolyl cis-trans isomerase C